MIDILDNNFKKIDIVRKYTFYQYVDKCREIGTFELRVPVLDETKWLVDRNATRYVLFDNKVLGKIQGIKYTSDSESDREVIISGSLAMYILAKRVIRGSVTFKGQSYKYIELLINSFLGNSEYPGHINVTVQYEDEERLKEVCSVVDRQVTGGYVWDEVSDVCEVDKLSVELVPVIVPQRVINGIETNVSGWKFIISAGVDRARKNDAGNEVVIFSQDMSNISGVDYNRDSRDWTGLAIVAGEGEGEQRKWFSVNREGQESKTGWDVEELWIDARDLQRELAGEETLTEEEYEELIRTRAKEKLAENDVKESYNSTLVTTSKKQYVFGEDYKKADFVTVDDKELGFSVDAQITSVTVSEQDGRKIIDPEFTYGNIVRDPIEGLKENVVISQQNKVNIKYIDDKVAELLKHDSVIEYGDNGEWAFRKWKSGVLEAWRIGQEYLSMNFKNAYGSLYYTDTNQWNTTGESCQFAEVNDIQMTVRTKFQGLVYGEIIDSSVGQYDEAAYFKFRLTNPLSLTIDCDVKVHIMGRWK